MTRKIFLRPSESTGAMPEEKVAEETRPSEVPASVDPLLQHQAELAAAQVEAEQWRDRFLRKAAEFDNFRKRTDKERTDSVLLAKSSVLAEFLHIMDACERALKSFGEAQSGPEALERFREGVQLLYKQMSDTLSRVGVTPVEVRGEQFDPHLHEALSREETSEYEDNTVIEELRRGYLFKDRLLRPAQVKVSTRPQREETTKS